MRSYPPKYERAVGVVVAHIIFGLGLGLTYFCLGRQKRLDDPPKMSDAAQKAVAAVAGLGFVYYFPKIFTTMRDWEMMPFVRSKAFYEREKEIHYDLGNCAFVYSSYDDGNPRRQLSDLAHGQAQQFAKPWPGGKPPPGYPHTDH